MPQGAKTDEMIVEGHVDTGQRLRETRRRLLASKQKQTIPGFAYISTGDGLLSY